MESFPEKEPGYDETPQQKKFIEDVTDGIDAQGANIINNLEIKAQEELIDLEKAKDLWGEELDPDRKEVLRKLIADDQPANDNYHLSKKKFQ